MSSIPPIGQGPQSFENGKGSPLKTEAAKITAAALAVLSSQLIPAAEMRSHKVESKTDENLTKFIPKN